MPNLEASFHPFIHISLELLSIYSNTVGKIAAKALKNQIKPSHTAMICSQQMLPFSRVLSTVSKATSSIRNNTATPKLMEPLIDLSDRDADLHHRYQRLVLSAAIF